MQGQRRTHRKTGSAVLAKPALTGSNQPQLPVLRVGNAVDFPRHGNGRMARKYRPGAIVAGDFPGRPDAQAWPLIGHVHPAGAATAAHDAEADFQRGLKLRIGHAGFDLPGIPGDKAARGAAKGRQPVIVGQWPGATFGCW